MVKRAGLALLVLGLSALAVFGGRLALLFVTMIVAAVAARELYRSLRAPGARRTWEHLAGALSGAVVAAVIAVAGASPPFTWARAFILGALVAVVLATGDLVWATIEDDLARSEPVVKRPRAIVLPRVGGALLSAPVFFYVFRALVS